MMVTSGFILCTASHSGLVRIRIRVGRVRVRVTVGVRRVRVRVGRVRVRVGVLMGGEWPLTLVN